MAYAVLIDRRDDRTKVVRAIKSRTCPNHSGSAAHKVHELLGAWETRTSLGYRWACWRARGVIESEKRRIERRIGRHVSPDL